MYLCSFFFKLQGIKKIIKLCTYNIYSPVIFFVHFFWQIKKKGYSDKKLVQFTHPNLYLPTLYIKTSIAFIWLPYTYL